MEHPSKVLLRFESVRHRNISFARSILLRKTNWCGASLVDLRNLREK